jgi:deoxyribonuclease-1-like protein
MSLNPGGILSLRALALCALAVGGYTVNRVVKIDGLEHLSVYLDGNQPDSSENSLALSSVYPQSQIVALPDSSATETVSSPKSIVGSLVSLAMPKGESGTPIRPVGHATVSLGSTEQMAPSSNLRIASWAINGFGPQQLRDPESASILVDGIRRFDIVALQQVRASERDFLPNLVAMLNRDGRAYDYLAGPLQGRNPASPPGTLSGDGEQLVFLYDTASVVSDRSQLYTVADPDNRLSHKPLVAWFRAAQVDPQRAWTFSLVNMRVDVSRARQEVYELPRLASVIGADGRGEDDIIFAGLLQADHSYLNGTLGGTNYWFATHDKSTDVYAKYQTSNLIVDRRTTTEAVLRGGVVDFLRIHNLSISQAEKVTPHLPVYAEFSPWEGGHR